MVCHGNICRSPLAKGIMIKKIHEQGIKNTEVDSAGTSGQHVGEPPDARTIANGLKHGVDVSSYKARQFKSADFESFDRIYVMDSANYADLMLLVENDEQRNKVKLFLEAAYPGSRASVPDPWYGAEGGFEEVYKILDKACTVVVKEVKKGMLP